MLSLGGAPPRYRQGNDPVGRCRRRPFLRPCPEGGSAGGRHPPAVEILEDVREGIIAAKIAAHIADIAKGLPGAMEKDIRMAKSRKEFDWQGQIDVSLDPERASAWLERSESAKEEGCTMCGEFCAIKLGKR